MHDPITKNIRAFEAMEGELERHHMGKFALFHAEKFIAAYDTFDNAAREAVKQFGDDVFLIRQVGKKPFMSVPASVAFHPIYAPH